MDTQRCQNHGPVRLLVPLLEFNLYQEQKPCRFAFIVAIIGAIVFLAVEQFTATYAHDLNLGELLSVAEPWRTEAVVSPNKSNPLERLQSTQELPYSSIDFVEIALGFASCEISCREDTAPVSWHNRAR